MNREEVEDNDQPSTVEEIEADLKAMSEFEPVLMTEQEQTRWEGERKARREWEKAHFFEYAERLRRLTDVQIPPG